MSNRNLKTELLGFSRQEECIIKCGDCNKPLLNVVVVESNSQRADRNLPETKNKYKADCCYCSGASFWSKTFEGTALVGTVSDAADWSVVSTDDGSEEKVLYNTIKVSRIKQ